jgi:hypothetical protein
MMESRHRETQHSLICPEDEYAHLIRDISGMSQIVTELSKRWATAVQFPVGQEFFCLLRKSLKIL